MLPYKPVYTITQDIIRNLMRIESVKDALMNAPVTPQMLASLRETARLYTTHYSTMIEGNKLTSEQIKQVITLKGHFPGRERDEQEVKGYYAALTHVEKWAAESKVIQERMIQTIHSLVMGNGTTRTKPTAYRDGQNVIKDGHSGAIVYMPPEAADVPELMKQLVSWITHTKDLSPVIVAGIAHYQFATIHPYYDGNGRTARLLTTFILHTQGYDMQGLYALEEYYARNLGNYYDALTIGNSHNYYMGRADADITPWLTYFTTGMASACEALLKKINITKTTGIKNQNALMYSLNPQQRKALTLFIHQKTIRSKDVGALFDYKPRTSAQLCARWVQEGFLIITNHSNKGRTYQLAPQYESLITNV